MMSDLTLKWLRKLQYLYNCRNFDREYYLKRYPDVAKAKMDPLEHYKKYGRYEGRYSSLADELGTTMDQKAYLKKYPEVAKSGMDPVVHYVNHGQVEGREMIKRNDNQIAQLRKENNALKNQNNVLKRENKYLYYQGLRPEQYPEELKKWYKAATGEELDLDNPKTYNEKMQWLKLYDSTPIKTRLADKYLAREWIKEKIGEKYLIPLLGVYDKFDDINFDLLPDKFVLKTNHGSGSNIIVKDKSQLDIEDARKKFEKWLSKNFAFVNGLELHYLNIVPKIIIEEYLENAANGQYEYQFYCFDGEVKFILVEVDRHTNHKRSLRTPEWARMDLMMRFPLPDYEIPKPKTLGKMLELASKLSQGFAHVRVDFYSVDENIYFGEMTFTSGSGLSSFTPKEYDKIFGNYICLPDKSEIPRLK